MNLRLIILPVDGSEHSRHAVEYAADLAGGMDAEIVVLNCQPPVPAFLGEPNFQQAVEYRDAEAEEILSPVRDYLSGLGLRFRDMAVEGAPGEAIADVAKAERADLIVIGSKGKTDLEGLVMGSVTHCVLHIAPCPVLVVR
ncbi:universal stress protein [Desulfocurvibacter africanus]|uniref:UspA domain-containing protein n=1 Tax=Desulfocurvibacter africanus subsp. africanus str. Walvis Bay TaxID=690850 RepID=F3Z0H3_DESAF|nr:universal stress protein [Desulfocurvibacter africanus]EGJ50983.1 UspA domain-containing protein [Desulfocurvibacter africanus subsp. africanus str. Walvis Bay]